jgi:hypothetical protein
MDLFTGLIKTGRLEETPSILLLIRSLIRLTGIGALARACAE